MVLEAAWLTLSVFALGSYVTPSAWVSEVRSRKAKIVNPIGFAFPFGA